MSRIILFLALFTFGLNSIAAENDLINFDVVKSLDYIKTHKVLKMKYSSIEEDHPDKKYVKFYGRNTVSNFSSITNSSCKIKVNYESWITPWASKEKPTYIYFELQKNSNNYTLIGFSKNDIVVEFKSKSKTKTTLKKFTEEDYKNPKYSNYISGGHEIYSDTYGHYWENKMDLHYPILFKEGKMNLYMDTYKLKKPLSLQILKEISENKYRSLVLAPVKGTLNTYKIVGYLDK